MFSFIFVFFLIYHLAESAVETENNIKYIISEKYVEIIAEELNSRINWSYFKIVKETKNYFFMNTKDGQKIMIPKKDFPDSETLVVFKNMLRTRLGNEAYLNTSKKTLNLK